MSTNSPTFLRVPVSTGVSLHVSMWNSDAASIERPPVVLHHGFAADAPTNWENPGIVGALISSGRAVAAVEARGHGRSDKPHEPSAYGHRVMSIDFAAVLAYLAEQGPAWQVMHVAGYSMGGYVVALTAAERPAHMKSLLIGGIGEPSLGDLPSRIRPAIAETFEHGDPAKAPSTLARQFLRVAQSSGSDLLALAAVMRSPWQPATGLGNIAIPTLVLVGIDDDLATCPEVLADSIPGARLVTTPGNHLSCLGTPKYRTELVAFFDAVDSVGFVSVAGA